MDQLPFEARLQHEIFIRQCGQMSQEQLLAMATTLHALYLNQSHYLKSVMRTGLGIGAGIEM